MSDEERHTHKVAGIEVNEISETGKRNMRLRALIALALIVTMVPCIVLGGWFLCALVFIVAVLAGYEITKAPHKGFPWWVYAITIINLVAMVFWPVIYTNVMGIIQNPDTYSFSLEGSFDRIGLFIQVAQFVIMILIYFWLGVGTKAFSFEDTSFFFTMVTVVGLGLQGVLVVRFMPYNELHEALGSAFGPFQGYFQSILLILFVAAGAIFNDTFAYFVGVLFGKHKMNEKISPKKTWEGFFGGWFFGTALSLVFGLVPAYFGCPMMPGIFDADHWYWILIASILLPLVGDLGDLSFSYVKRHYGFKDYSKLLGPHGGILDRIDSLLFCYMTVATIISIANFVEMA